VLEARLDEIQNEIRHLALRLEPASGAKTCDYDEIYRVRACFDPSPATPMGGPVTMALPRRHELENGGYADDRTGRRPPPARPPCSAASLKLDVGRVSEPLCTGRWTARCQRCPRHTAPAQTHIPPGQTCPRRTTVSLPIARSAEAISCGVTRASITLVRSGGLLRRWRRARQ